MFHEYRHWIPYIVDFYLPCADSETGDFRFLPFEGGAGDQPYMTMQILRLVQVNYRKHLNEKMKSIKAGSKKSRH